MYNEALYRKQQIGDAFINNWRAIINKLNVYDSLRRRVEFDTRGLQHRGSNSWKLYRFEYLAEMGKHVTRG